MITKHKIGDILYTTEYILHSNGINIPPNTKVSIIKNDDNATKSFYSTFGETIYLCSLMLDGVLHKKYINHNKLTSTNSNNKKLYKYLKQIKL